MQPGTSRAPSTRGGTHRLACTDPAAKLLLTPQLRSFGKRACLWQPAGKLGWWRDVLRNFEGELAIYDMEDTNKTTAKCY